MIGSLQADQSISFQLMSKKLISFIDVVKNDPAVAGVVGFTGGSATNSGFVFASLKPLSERDATSDQVIERLRDRVVVPGAQLLFQAGQDLRIGGRQGNAQYQYTLQADELSELYAWTPRITKALSQLPELSDVSSDQQEQGLETDLVIDRASASRLQACRRA